MPIGYEMHPFLKSPKYKALCSPRGWYRCRLARAFCCWPALGGSNHLVPGTKPSAPMYLVPAPGKQNRFRMEICGRTFCAGSFRV